MVTDKYYITTIGGRSFNPLSPSDGDIDIRDIAHSLSMLCRANGHFSEFFSVARHCVNAAKEAAERGFGARIQLLCLLHDAAEAYIGDMTRPLKRQIPLYRERENELIDRIIAGFGIPLWSDEEKAVVSEMDDCMLYHEFLNYNGDMLYEVPPEIHIEIVGSERKFAETEAEYLALFERLMREAGYEKC